MLPRSVSDEAGLESLRETRLQFSFDLDTYKLLQKQISKSKLKLLQL